MKRLLIINGANLNMLGLREPEIYGKQSFEDYLNQAQDKFIDVASINYAQSNIEGELINFILNSESKYDGLIINAGAYSHTSIAIADAITCISIPVIEVHISNIFAREEYRHHSFISKNCKGVIIGFGFASYDLAIQYLIS